MQLATLDKKTIVLNREEIDAHELIEEAIRGFSLILNERNGKMRADLSAEKSVLYIDSLHFTNIIYNLIDNAIKYSPENPVVEVKTWNEKSRFLLSITDNGIGIEKNQQNQIFDKFYRVPTGNLHDVKGFGLGLNYVKTVVELQEGQISLESELGKGSKFTIEMPLSS